MSDQTAQFTKRRRRRKAAGGRIAVTGMSAGAALGLVGAIAAHSLPATTTRRVVSPVTARPRQVATRPVPTPTTIVWRVVHRVVVVNDPPVAARSPSTTRHTWQPSYASAPTHASASMPAPLIMPAPAAVSAAPAPAQVAPPPASPVAPAPTPAPPTCSGTKCP